MAELQLFDLAKPLAAAEEIKSAQRTNRLGALLEPYKVRQVQREEQDAVSGQQDARLKRGGMIAGVGLQMLGDKFDSLTEDQRAQSWEQMVQGIRTIAPDIDMNAFPSSYSDQNYRLLQGISKQYGGGAGGNVQSTYINDKGQRVAVMRDGSERVLGMAESNFRLTDDNLVFDPRGGTVALPGAAPAPGAPSAPGGASGADLIAQQKEAEFQRRLKQLEEEGKIEIKTAGGKRKAELGAEVTMAPQVADAKATVAGAEQGAKAAQDSITAAISVGEDAARSIAPITRAIDLLDQVKTGGVGSQAWLAAQQLVGVESGDAGELSNLLGKSVLGQLRMTFGAAFTQAEGERLAGIEAGFGKSPETNRRLLKNALDIMRNAAERGIRAAERRGDTFMADELRRQIDFKLGGDDGAKQQQQQLPQTDSNGWRLMKDKNGKRAYVSPDGKQYREVP